MTTTTTTGISRDELKALRGANSIVFRWNTDARPDLGYVGSFIEATKEHDPHDGFGKRDLCVSIPVETPIVTSYADNGTPVGACAVFTTASFHAELVTAFRFIRPGDLLTPVYVCSNNSDTLRAAGLHLDETKLRVVRGDKVHTFLLDVRVVPTYSLVRDVAFR